MDTTPPPPFRPPCPNQAGPAFLQVSILFTQLDENRDDPFSLFNESLLRYAIPVADFLVGATDAAIQPAARRAPT